MGTGVSKNSSSDGSNGGREWEAVGGGQLYVSLKMENFTAQGELIPHVYGSVPIVGSWEPSKAVSELHRPSLHGSEFFFLFHAYIFRFPPSFPPSSALHGAGVCIDVGTQLRRPSQPRYQSALLLCSARKIP